MENKQNNIMGSVERLIETRGWEEFHVPCYLVSSLLVECSELMNECLWHTPEEINEMFQNRAEKIVNEMADIAINYFSLVHYCHLDVEKIVDAKVNELIVRYQNLKHGEHR